jgi:uncharacterized protein YeaO (DUF488 family)
LIQLKRAYAPSSARDGYRVLVERLWPRGLRKENARLDGWLKEVAPSDALRRWFGHEPDRWTEFRARYQEELRSRGVPALQELRRRARSGPLTLVYAARDTERNSAVVLAEELRRRSPARPKAAADVSGGRMPRGPGSSSRRERRTPPRSLGRGASK